MIENSSKGNGTGCISSRLSSQWLRNPRIVRVSRALGGKDRHSKVCTVRGLRDRRIRLSVPTAIQLYDLQDRLGLSQPSKVVDWLLEATKSDIDKLPPLHINPHCNNLFPQFQSPVPLNVAKSRYNYLDLDVNSSLKGKEVAAYNGGMACHFSQFGSHGYNTSNWQQQQQQQQQGADNNSSNSQFLFSATPSFLAIESDPPKQYFNNNNNVVLHQMLNSSSSSSSSQVVMPPINNVLFHSPLKRLPTLFSSKLLDFDHNNNNRSQPANKSDTS